MKKNKENLEKEGFEKKFGSLYSDLRTQTSTTLAYCSVFCFRRLIIAITAVFLGKWGIVF